MRKFYMLFFIINASFSYGQNLIVNGSLESWTGGVPDSFPTIDFNTTDLSENTDPTFITEGASSARVNLLTKEQGSTDIRQTVALTGGTTYLVSLDVYATNNEARVRIFDGSNFNNSQYSDETILNNWQTVSFEYTPTDDEAFEVGMRFYDLSSNWDAGTQSSLFYIDNFKIVESTNPVISISSPADGSTIVATDVDIEISVQNFTVATNASGDGFIQYIIDGGSTIEKYDLSPIGLSDLSQGTHTVELELVDNVGQRLTPRSQASVTFTVAATNEVGDIAELRAGTIGEVYELTSEAFITYIVTDGNRNQKYIQDGTAAILIDDPNGVLTTSFNIGDGIAGLQGQLTEFRNLLQFVPVANVPSASSTGTTITPETVLFSEFLANGESYESELIKIEEVVFFGDIGNGTFEDDTNYTISRTGLSGDPTVILRTSFGDENLIGANIPTSETTITGLGGQFDTDYQVLPRYLSDIQGATLSIGGFGTGGFNMYPNPVSSGFLNITSTNNHAISVTVFDILGKLIFSETLTQNGLSVSALNAGVYILQITQNQASITKKLVVK